MTGETGRLGAPRAFGIGRGRRNDHQRGRDERHSAPENDHTALQTQHLSSPNLSPDPDQPNPLAAGLWPCIPFALVTGACPGSQRGRSEIFCQILFESSVVRVSIVEMVSSTTPSVLCSAHNAAVLAVRLNISEQ